MRDVINTYSEKFKHTKRMRRRVVSVLVALALVVSGCVFWELHSDGVAMANETYCGMEEHQHGEDCYEQILVCGEEESEDSEEEADPEKTAGHVHDESCYEKVLICETPEHIHTIECLCDDTADVETSSEWEATLPDNLTGIWADDVVSIAQSQVGYKESEANFQLAEDGENRQGYSRYGAWYGNEYGDWDAMFASFCLHYAGIPESEFPEASGAYAWATALKEKQADQDDDVQSYVVAEGNIPKPGDLIFFDADKDGKVDRVGIVEEVKTEGKDTNVETLQKITVIEGDSHDAVERTVYDYNSTDPDEIAAVKTIAGYGVLPKQTETEEEEVNTLTYTGSDYIVTVTYDSAAKLPEGTELTVSEYEKDSETYLARYEEAAELYGWNEGVDSDAEEEYKANVEDGTDEENTETASENIRLFNISLLISDENGNLIEIEPAAPVQVTITYLSVADEEEGYMVTHFGDETEELDVDITEEDGARSLTFDVGGFSDFLVSGGISTFAWGTGGDAGHWYSDNDHFKFINTDDTLSQHHDSGKFEPDSGHDYIEDNGNYFHIIDEDTNPVNTKNKFTLNATTLDTTSLPSGITFERDDEDGKWLLLLDISDISGGNGTPNLDELYNNLAAWGTTYENLGTITFKNAGTIAGGSSVDVKVTFDSIQLYNHYAQRQINSGNSNPQVPKDQLFTFANIDDSDLWISENYTSDWKSAWEGGYSYPCDMDVNLTIQVVLSGTNTVVDMSFLMVASDLDGYRTSNWGSGAETFKTISGFNGNYYFYPTDADNIATAVYYSNDGNESSTGVGVVTAQAYNPDSQDYQGDEGYKLGGIYADTTGGTFKAGYSEVWCGTRVEIYDYTSNDITIQKEDFENSEILLDGAEFIVYKDVSAGDEDYPYTLGDPEYGTNDPVRIYYKEEQTAGDTVIAAVWSTDKEDAKKFTTGEDGQVIIRCLYPCDDYYLEEVKAPDGYNLLEEPIQFELTSYGVVILKNGSQFVTVSSDDDLKIIVKNGEGVELPNTGGPGVIPFTTAGILLMGVAGWSLYRNRKRGVIKS